MKVSADEAPTQYCEWIPPTIHEKWVEVLQAYHKPGELYQNTILTSYAN